MPILGVADAASVAPHGASTGCATTADFGLANIRPGHARRAVASPLENPVLHSALVTIALALAPPSTTASTELRKWFDEYRRGGIDLHQPVPAAIVVPAASDGGPGATEVRYCSSAAVDALRAKVDAARVEDSLPAARVLVDLATYQPIADVGEERRRFVARQPWLVRRLGLEALAQLRSPAAREWLAQIALHDTDPLDGVRTRAAACRALGATMDASLLAPIAAALNDDAAVVRTEAAAALGALGSPLALTALEGAIADADESVRLEALLAIDAITIDKSELAERRRTAFSRAITDSAWPIRLAAARLLGRVHDPRAIPILIDALIAEAPGGVGRPDARRRVRTRIRASLMELTGKDFPSDRAADWSAWWKDIAATFEIDPNAIHTAVPEQGPRFFGIPLETDVVLFLIDGSGSMDRPAQGNDPPSRLFLAQFELKRCLSALDPGTRFNIVVFNDELVPFKPAAVAKDATTLREALDFIARIEAKGGTDLHQALDFALGVTDGGRGARARTEQVDTIVLLSDGVASRGAVLLPEELLAQTLAANRSLQVALHGVNASTTPSVLLDRLTAGCDGVSAALTPK